MSKRYKLILLLAAIIVALFIWLHFRKSSAVHYQTEKATRGSIIEMVGATGTLNPVGNTTIDSTGTVTGGVTVGAQVNGRIMSVNVGFNSHVHKGQLLAEIDPTTYESDVQSAQADLLNAEASIATAQANLAKDQANLINAKKTFDRDQVLVQKNYIAKSDLDTAEAAYQAALAQVNSDHSLILAASDIYQNKAAGLRKAQTNLSYTKILSPVDGIVIASNTAVGQTVVSSFQSPNLFVIAKSLQEMQIDTLVDEADLPKIRVGQTAQFNIDSYPNETFKGRVSQIRNNPITQQNVVNYDVIVYVPNPGEKFLPGMTANVNFIIAQHDNVLMIPNRALLFVPPQSGGKQRGAGGGSPSGASQGGPPSGQGGRTHRRKENAPQVWILAKNKPVPVNVTLGISDGTNTEVTNGLSEGEEVITGTGQQKAKANPFSTF